MLAIITVVAVLLSPEAYAFLCFIVFVFENEIVFVIASECSQTFLLSQVLLNFLCQMCFYFPEILATIRAKAARRVLGNKTNQAA